jgi:hypothetical protein
MLVDFLDLLCVTDIYKVYVTAMKATLNCCSQIRVAAAKLARLTFKRLDAGTLFDSWWFLNASSIPGLHD